LEFSFFLWSKNKCNNEKQAKGSNPKEEKERIKINLIIVGIILVGSLFFAFFLPFVFIFVHWKPQNRSYSGQLIDLFIYR